MIKFAFFGDSFTWGAMNSSNENYTHHAIADLVNKKNIIAGYDNYGVQAYNLLEVIERIDAVKLPGQPKVCYDRKTLKQWFNENKTNPQDREEVEQDWINKNMGENPCEPAPETVFNIPSKGGKRKTKKSKRKSKKSNRKTRRR